MPSLSSSVSLQSSFNLRPKLNSIRIFYGLKIFIWFFFQTITLMKCSASYGQRISSPSSSYNSHAIPAAINTHHTINHYDVDIPKEEYKPNLIEVQSSVPMFHIKFQSSSSKVNVFHEHESSQGNKEPIESYSEDEPHILRHQVLKPVVQQIHEIITPVRKIVQEIKPVSESIETIVSKSSSSPSSPSSSTSSYKSSTQSTPTTKSLSTYKSSTPLSLKKSHTINLKLEKSFIQDLNQWLSNASKRRPDLLFKTEDEFLDNTLYNGANEYDLKYPSPNNIDSTLSSYSFQTFNDDYRLYQD